MGSLETQEAAASLRESEERFRSLFETMTQGVIYQNAQGEIISANPAAERILGLTFDQIRGPISGDPLVLPIADFYQTNAICRASRTMAQCSASLLTDSVNHRIAEAAE